MFVPECPSLGSLGGSGCSSQTSGVARQPAVSERWWQEAESRLPSCRSAAPPAASALRAAKRRVRNKHLDQICTESSEGVTFVQDGVGRFVPGHRLLAEVLVGLCQTLHLAEAGVQSHGGVGGVLRHVEVGGATQLLLDHQRLLQQLDTEGGLALGKMHRRFKKITTDGLTNNLESSGQELVLDFQEVAPVHLSFERLVEDGEPHVVLDVLPASVTVSGVSGG